MSQAVGDASMREAMELREIANWCLARAAKLEHNAILAWAKAEQIETRLPALEPSPPLDTARPPC